MARYAKSYERKKRNYVVGGKVLIICEDVKSCKTYLEDAKKHFGVDAVVEVVHLGCTDPLNIVKRALEKCSNFHIVYCVIDRDTHENFDQACKLLRNEKAKVELVVSYPCFEYWLYLHFKYTRAGYQPGRASPGAQMLSALVQIPEMIKYKKGEVNSLFDLLLTKLATARENSQKALADAIAVDEMNPSTRMHELFDAFEAMALER